MREREREETPDEWGDRMIKHHEQAQRVERFSDEQLTERIRRVRATVARRKSEALLHERSRLRTERDRIATQRARDRVRRERTAEILGVSPRSLAAGRSSDSSLPFLGCRVSEDLRARVDLAAEEAGMTKSDWIRRAIERALPERS